jgi:Uma2 family endonuclease
MSTESRPAVATKLDYEEFLARYDGVHAEWVDGEVVVLSPNTPPHQGIVRFLAGLISWVAEEDDLGEVYTDKLQMRLRAPVNRGREPDVLFVNREHLDRIGPTYLDGPADLVVEVISRESIGRDRGEKFVEYEQARVPELWLIDYEREQAEFYVLGEDGRYGLVVAGARGTYQSRALPRLRLQLEWLWQQPLPKLRDVLRQLELL